MRCYCFVCSCCNIVFLVTRNIVVCWMWSWQCVVMYHEIVFKRITHKFCIFCRVAFSWHPPVFFSSDLGHVTPPLSCACHVTVRLCCRQRGGCAGLCLGWGWGIWIWSRSPLERLFGTTCYHGRQSWCSGSLTRDCYTPYDGQLGKSLCGALWVSVLGLVPFRRCSWLHSRGMSVDIPHHICLGDCLCLSVPLVCSWWWCGAWHGLRPPSSWLGGRWVLSRLRCRGGSRDPWPCPCMCSGVWCNLLSPWGLPGPLGVYRNA